MSGILQRPRPTRPPHGQSHRATNSTLDRSNVLLAVAVSVALVSCSSGNEHGSGAGCATCVTVGARGFSPPALTLEKGDAGSTTAVTFTRTTDDACARWIVVPELMTNLPLPLDKPVTINVPTSTARTLTFQCGTAAHSGKLVVR